MEDHMSKHIPEAPIASRSEKGPGDHHEIASDTTHMKHPDRSEVGAAPARQLCAGQNPGPNEVPDGAGLFFLNPPFRTSRIGDDLHEEGSLTERGDVMNRSPPRARSHEKSQPMATTPMRRNRCGSRGISVR